MLKTVRFIAILLLSCSLLPKNAAADIQLADPLLVTNSNQWFEASSQYNVVFHVTITADAMGDTLQTFGIWDDVEVPYAQDGVDIVTGSVRLWYVPVDTGAFSTSTAQFVCTLDNGGAGNEYVWYSMSVNKLVVNGSGLYVTLDITSSPTPNAVCSFYTYQNSWDFTSTLTQPPTQSPVYPQIPPTAYNFISSYHPATDLEVTHIEKSLSQLSSGQTFYPLDLTLHNTGSPFMAPVFLSGITLTVKNESGVVIAPNTAIESIGFRNKLTQVVLSTVTAIPSSPTGVYIPLSVSITALADMQLELFATVHSNTVTVVSSFKMEISQAADFNTTDAYTRKPISVLPALGDSFPMPTSLFTIFFSATNLDVYHTSVLPQNEVVLKGQTNINPLNFSFINPGTTRTSRADVTHMTLVVTDGDGDPISPATVFSRVAIAGGLLYGETTTIPTTGSLVTITLTNSYASVPVYQPLTVTVLVDIRPDASAVEFRLSLAGSAGVIAQDANTILPINVRAAYASDPFPMFSNTIRIASTFLLTSRSLAPTTLYPDQRTPVLELTFTHPGPTDAGNLLVHGITISAQDMGGVALALAPNCSRIFITDAQGTLISQTSPLGTDSWAYLPIPNLAIAPFTSVVLRLEVQITPHPETQTLRLGIVDRNHVAVTQPADLSRPVYVSGAWPILSNSAAVGGGEGELKLSNYPNPFAAGKTATQIGYFLQQSPTVTLRLYTLAGDQVQSLAESEFQTAGGQIKSWDGRTASSGVVKNGVYLLRIEVVPVSDGKTITQTRKIAVVK